MENAAAGAQHERGMQAIYTTSSSSDENHEEVGERIAILAYNLMIWTLVRQTRGVPRERGWQ